MVDLILPILFFFIALIYSAVGLGGGSSYTALMAIFGINYLWIPTTSLTLNLLVTFIGMINFWKNGHGRHKLIMPFLITSIPMTYLSGTFDLSETLFKLLLLFTLIIVAVRIYFINGLQLTIKLTTMQKLFLILFIGAFLGFIAGTVGIGGGIYLVPLIIMFGMGTEKEAAAAGTMFIWVNSLVGLIARTKAGTFDLNFILPLVISVIAGGFLGSYLGAKKFNPETIQKIMGLVVLIAIFSLIKDLL